MKQNNINLQLECKVAIYTCESIKEIETNILKNEHTWGNQISDDYKTTMSYLFIKDIMQIDEIQNQDLIIILGNKEEISNLNTNFINHNKTPIFAIAIDESFSLQKSNYNVPENIDFYIIVKNEKDLKLAIQSILDTKYKYEHIPADESGILNDRNRIMYFVNMGYEELVKGNFLEEINNNSKATRLTLFLYQHELENENIDLLKYLEIVNKIDKGTEQRQLDILYYTYSITKEHEESVRMFIGLSPKNESSRFYSGI